MPGRRIVHAIKAGGLTLAVAAATDIVAVDKRVVVADGAMVGVDKKHDRARGFAVSSGGITVVGNWQQVTP